MVNLPVSGLNSFVISAKKAGLFKSSMPILQDILVSARGNTVELQATNMDIFFSKRFSTPISDTFEVLVEATAFQNALSNFNKKEHVEISLCENYMQIKGSLCTANVYTQTKEGWPEFERTYSDNICVSSAALVNSLKLPMTSVACDDPRVFLNGVLFENADGQLKLVSVDGHRLGLVRTSIPWALDSAIIPRNGLTLLDSFSDDLFVTTDKAFSLMFIVFFNKDTELMIRTIEGEFPDYNRVCPKTSNGFVEFSSAILKNAISGKAFKENTAVVFEIHPQQSAVTIRNIPKTFSCAIGCDSDFNYDLTVGFDRKYILDAINNIESDIVRFAFSSELDPLVITGKSQDKMAVIMPVRCK